MKNLFQSLIFTISAAAVLSLAGQALGDEREERHRHIEPGESAMIYGVRGKDCEMDFPTEEEIIENSVSVVRVFREAEVFS